MPLSHSERHYLIALSHCHGLSPVRLREIYAVLGSAEAIWQASSAELKHKTKWPEKLIQKLIEYRQHCEPEQLMHDLQQFEIQVCFQNDAHYPQQLKAIYDPPLLLYWRGQAQTWKKLGRSIAVIGTRKPTPYGIEMAQRTARWLAQHGAVVVSGMALGIDALAHQGALQTQGDTLAVLGSGLNKPSPYRHRKLFQDIQSQGLVISEFAPDHPAAAWTFPMRNRIVSGLSSAIVVIEAGLKSGTLITVDCANEQGREVFALPGWVTSSQSEGTHALIQQGAALLQHPREIFVSLNWEISPEIETNSVDSDLTNAEQHVYALLSEQPVFLDLLVSKFQGAAPDLLSILSLLELKGVAEQLPGKLYKRKSP